MSAAGRRNRGPRRVSTVAAAVLMAALAVAPGAAGGHVEPAPAWMEVGLDAAVLELWLDDVDAVGETAEPIDHGDFWAWTGDNAKLLSAMAPTPAAHGSHAASMADFLMRMHEGPILFQRWANTHETVVIENQGGRIEASNHLLTLRMESTGGPVAYQIEYHDGRDKRMAQAAAANVRVGDAWLDLAAHVTDTRVVEDADGVAIERSYAAGAVRATESYRLGAAPGVLHTFALAADSAPIAGVRFPFASLEVVSTDRPLAAGHYHEAYLGTGGRTAGDQLDGQGAGSQWLMFMDRGTTDEFANGLLVRAGARGPVEAVRVDARAPGQESALKAASLEYGGGAAGAAWSQRIVPLDGLVTAHPQVYGELSARLEATEFTGVDLSLSYEISETVLGLLHHAEAVGDEAAVAAATGLFESYLGFYARGTQTRSLASGVQAALALAGLTGEDQWTQTARTLAEDLRTYQVTEPARPEFGALVNEPGGGPFLDSTLAAANAWNELAQASGDDRYAAWADEAWGSLVSDGDTIFIRGDVSDDNHWAFKSGLALQGSPGLPQDIRWAALNHVWTVVRDVASYEAHTSRFSAETNSETQAWVMLGLYRDWAARQGPWILDSEGVVTLRQPEGNESLRVAPAWPGAFLWLEPGHVAYSDGVVSPRTPAAHGSWRYEVAGDVRLWPSEARPLPAGWHALAWPGLEQPAAVSRALQGLPVVVAWAYDPAQASWSHWRPGAASSTLDAVGPGQGLLVLLEKPAAFEERVAPGSPPELSAGWNLVSSAAAAGFDVAQPALAASGSGPLSAVWTSADGGGRPPSPPMLVTVASERDYAYRLRGGLVQARGPDGDLLGQAHLDDQGACVLVVAAPRDDVGRVRLTMHWPDGEQLAAHEVAWEPGVVSSWSDPAPPAAPMPFSGWIALAILWAATLATAGVWVAVRYRVRRG